MSPRISYRRYSTDDAKYLERHKRIARDLPNNFLNVKNLASQVAEEVVALTYEDEKRRYEEQRRDMDDRIAEQDRKVRDLDERREGFMEECRVIRQEAVDSAHKKNQDFLGRAAIWLTVAITGVTLLVALMVFFLTPMASEITTQRVSENAVSELRSEDLSPLEEEIERLEDRLDEIESRQP